LKFKSREKNGVRSISIRYRGITQTPFTDEVPCWTFSQMRATARAYTTGVAGSRRPHRQTLSVEQMCAAEEPALLWSLVHFLFTLSSGESKDPSFSTPKAVPAFFDDALEELTASSGPMVGDAQALKRMKELVQGSASGIPSEETADTQPGVASRSTPRKRLRINAASLPRMFGRANGTTCSRGSGADATLVVDPPWCWCSHRSSGGWPLGVTICCAPFGRADGTTCLLRPHDLPVQPDLKCTGLEPTVPDVRVMVAGADVSMAAAAGC